MMEFAYRHLAGIHVNALEVGQEKIVLSKFHLARKGWEVPFRNKNLISNLKSTFEPFLKDRRGSPCYNKGKCLQKSVAPYFTCDCPENYTGLYCELFREKRLEFVPNDEAALQDERCHNGASFDKKTDTCKCLPGFNGESCEKVRKNLNKRAVFFQKWWNINDFLGFDYKSQ